MFGGMVVRSRRKLSLKDKGRKVLCGASRESKQGAIMRRGGSDWRAKRTGMRKQLWVQKGPGHGRNEGIILES